jgi:hypothetical protein
MLSRKDNSVNPFLQRLNKLGALSVAIAHIAILAAVAFQALHLSASAQSNEGQAIAANASQVVGSPTNKQSREANEVNVTAAGVHLDGDSILTVADATQTNPADTTESAANVMNWRPASDEHFVKTTFKSTSHYEGAGDRTPLGTVTTAHAVPALLSPIAPVPEASGKTAHPSPEKPDQPMFTDIPGGIFAASTIILTLIIVLARARRSPAAEG